MTSTIQGTPVSPTPPASGEGLIFNGTVYVPTPANAGGPTLQAKDQVTAPTVIGAFTQGMPISGVNTGSNMLEFLFVGVITPTVSPQLFFLRGISSGGVRARFTTSGLSPQLVVMRRYIYFPDAENGFSIFSSDGAFTLSPSQEISTSTIISYPSIL